MSQGEQLIYKFLKDNNFSFKEQYRFKDCKDKYTLPFDFAVFNKQNKLIFLIEYDGEGHFEPFRYSKDKNKMEQKLKETQRRDKIKDIYCKEKSIPLIRIPYWKKDNINKILENELLNSY